MANVRIKDLTTDTSLSAGDYIIVDSTSEGTRKFDIGSELSGINENIGDLSDLDTTDKSSLVDAINEVAAGGGGGGGGGGSGPSPYTSTPSDLGTASAGSSSNYSRGDHVHNMPSASDVGAIATPSTASSGDFLVYNGSAWVAQSLSTWTGGSY